MNVRDCEWTLIAKPDIRISKFDVPNIDGRSELREPIVHTGFQRLL